MKVYALKIRRDAHTITPTDVPQHEIAILQTVFGEESVQNMRGESIAMQPLTEADVVGDIKLDKAVEFDRLMGKYGSDEKGPVVEQVYGKKAARGLETAMAAIAAEEAEAPADDAKAKKTGTKG